MLRAVLKFHEVLFAKPTLVDDDCTHPSWKHFKGCLSALDDTLIDVTVPEVNKARYHTHKGNVSVNVLVAYDRGMHFTYMLAAWEGSVTDARILRDAVARDDGLRVPHGIMDGDTAEQGLAKLRNRNDKGRRDVSVREEQVFPNTDLKSAPHITSRMTVWKRNYHSLFEILKNTGVDLDSTTKMIEATDPNARLMRRKSWPLYEDWCEILGQSRATGEATDESQSPSGFAQTGDSNDGEDKQWTQKKAPLNSDLMVSVVQNFCDNASNRLCEIAQTIGYDQDMSAARKMIYSSVSKMNTLTLQEKMHATTLIARNSKDIDVFFSLPDTDRMEWVILLLNGDI
ncbi:hypothetical protein ACS0TY_011414 [Phlomoides rotata]